MATSPAPDQVALVLKFVKTPGSSGPSIRFDPASCSICVPNTSEAYNADDPRETVIALNVPRMRSLELTFIDPSSRAKRVILEAGDLPFRRDGSRLVVAIPALSNDAITAAEDALHVVEPGMVLRLEHADPVKRAGFYASGRYPSVEKRAAANLEFAQREVIRELGLGELVRHERLGTIQLMGFDTNAPHGHIDSPPHAHMHLRWPGNAGTQIAHYFIGSDGLLSTNKVYLKGFDVPYREYGKNEPFTTVGPDGRPVYTHTITSEGWLQLGRSGEKPCLIKPLGDGGFETGAVVSCQGRIAVSLGVEDDPVKGVVTVRTGPVTEIFRYDIETGWLKSPSKAPAPGPSVFVAPDTD